MDPIALLEKKCRCVCVLLFYSRCLSTEMYESVMDEWLASEKNTVQENLHKTKRHRPGQTLKTNSFPLWLAPAQ